MFQRDNSYLLSKNKSTFPTHDRLFSPTLELSLRHAYTAANIAFSRAEVKGSSIGADFSQENKPCYNNLFENFRCTRSRDTSRINRRDSVRFVGSSSFRRNESRISRATNSFRPKSVPDIRKTISNNSLNLEHRSPRCSPAYNKSNLEEITKSFNVTDSNDEDSINEKDSSSSPSSYRRIKKSKSMFIPARNSEIFYKNCTTRTRQASNSEFSRSQNFDTQLPQVALKVSRSTNLIQPKRRRSESNDIAVKLAQERFLHEAALQRIREKSSSFFRSKTQRHAKSPQNSYLSTYTDKENPKILLPNQDQDLTFKNSSFKGFASKTSRLVRSKIKKSLRISKDNIDEIPLQQVDAKQTHVRICNKDSLSIDNTLPTIFHKDGASLSEVTSGIPLICEAASDEMIKSQVGSIRSFKTHTSNETSRVTSWNSTAVNTVCSRYKLIHHPVSDQRLAILNQIGVQSPSLFSNQSDKIADNLFDNNIHQLKKAAVNNLDSKAVNSARVYSALMKRLKAKNSRSKFESSQSNSSTLSPSQGYNCKKNSHLNFENQGNMNLATIKHISSDDMTGESSECDRLQGKGPGLVQINSRRQNSTKTNSSKHSYQSSIKPDVINQKGIKNNVDYHNFKKNHGDKENEWRVKSFKCRKDLSDSLNILHGGDNVSSCGNSSDNYNNILRESGHENDYLISDSKILREKKSTFFSGGSVPVIKTDSPFRRAMTENAYKTYSESPELSHELESQIRESNYSESIYSCTTSGKAKDPNNSVCSLIFEKGKKSRKQSISASNSGDAVIFEQAVYTPKIPPKSRHRLISPTDSSEWKSWMSLEVAKLERGKENIPSVETRRHTLQSLTKPTPFNISGITNESQVINIEEVSQCEAPLCEKPLVNIQHSENLRDQSSLVQIQPQNPLKFFEKSREISESPLTLSSLPPAPPPLPHLTQSPTLTYIKLESPANALNPSNQPSDTSAEDFYDTEPTTHLKLIPSSLENHSNDFQISANLKRHFSRSLTSLSASLSNTDGSLNKLGDMSTRSRSYRSERRLGVHPQRSNVHKSDWKKQADMKNTESKQSLNKVGSNRMVEVFLSSRRRRIASASDDTGSLFL